MKPQIIAFSSRLYLSWLCSADFTPTFSVVPSSYVSLCFQRLVDPGDPKF